MTVEVTRIRLFFQRFSLVFYLGQIGIRLFGQKIRVGSLKKKALARSSTMGSNSLYPRSCRCCPARRRCVAHRAASAANATPPPSPCACGRPSNGPAVQKRAGPEMGPLRCVASPAMGLPRAARRAPAMEPPREASVANGSKNFSN